MHGLAKSAALSFDVWVINLVSRVHYELLIVCKKLQIESKDQIKVLKQVHSIKPWLKKAWYIFNTEPLGSHAYFNLLCSNSRASALHAGDNGMCT